MEIFTAILSLVLAAIVFYHINRSIKTISLKYTLIYEKLWTVHIKY